MTMNNLRVDEKPTLRYETMVACLRDRAKQTPNKTAIVFVSVDGENPRSYAQLDARCRSLAAQLQQKYSPGDRALIMLNTSEEYVVAFFACLYAGLIAVPAFPPESNRKQHLSRLVAITDDAKAVCLLVSRTIEGILANTGRVFGDAEAIFVDEVDTRDAEKWQQHIPLVDDIAFLQYTSGSTSTPKGVMVSHGNLIANEQVIETAYSLRSDDVFGSWLPLFHDMGLIGTLLQPLHGGFLLVLMNPSYFLERPRRWLEVISKYQVTVSGGPDFAYQMCLQRIKPKDFNGLDLSSWRIAFSGSEPVRYDTLKQFTEYFTDIGFSSSAPYPCYGLAEATLMLSGGRRDMGMIALPFDLDALKQGRVKRNNSEHFLVACGTAQPGHQVVIFDVQTLQPAAENCVGEIWATGDSIAKGYWQNPKAVVETFVEYNGKRWLRTGDLGFYHEGQLYIAGRCKDVIIINGQNYYPQDIEKLVEDNIDISREGRVAAFRVIDDKGPERLGIAMELSRRWLKNISVSEFVAQVNQVVAQFCQHTSALVILLNPGGLPKTSSGKLQRSACFKQWNARGLDFYAAFDRGFIVYASGEMGVGEANQAANQGDQREFETDTEKTLAAIWGEVLAGQADAFTPNSCFILLGGDSLRATQVASRISKHWNIVLAPHILFDSPRLGECAAKIDEARSSAQSTSLALRIYSEEEKPTAIPLSAAQARQWFLWRMEPQSSAYHISGAIHFNGELDRGELHRCLEAMIERHHAMRTVFCVNEQGAPEQIVLDQININWLEVDAENQPVEAIAQQWFDEPFVLNEGPLFRFGLIRVGNNESYLVLVIHHIITDGWSLGLFVRELMHRYTSAKAGENVVIVPLTLQYSDYSLWQQQWLESKERQQQLDYWQQQLGSEHPVLQLPTDFPRHAIANYREVHHTCVLLPEQFEPIRAYAQRSEASVFVVMMAALQTLLYRYTGQQDIRVGVPIANRNHVALESLLGLFVNTLVLRSELSGQMTLNELVAHIRQTSLEGQAHQQLPFEQLVNVLQPQRSLTHSPLFQVVYNHQIAGWDSPQQPDSLKVDVVALEVKKQAQFELTLDVVENSDGSATLRFDYAQQLFKANSIKRLAEHYVALLGQLVQKPEQRLAQVPLLTPPQLEQLYVWGSRDLSLSSGSYVHRRFELLAEKNPTKVALQCGDQVLSYYDLNLRANRIAHYLITRGVSAESKVGIAADRDVDMIVSVLAVLKSGAAYVPLDPHYPDERLSYMYSDSAVHCVLTKSHHIPNLPLTESVTAIALDKLDLNQQAISNPAVTVHAKQLAYVIYTSGSTGKPKGVAVSHGALDQHIQASLDYIGLSASDRMLQFATLNFDSCIEQIFCPLAIGATIVLRGDELWDSPTFHHQVIEQQITIADLTTAYWSMLVKDFHDDGISDFGPLRQMHVGGEAMPHDSLGIWNSSPLKGLRLLNVYGPTETLVTATYHECGEQATTSAVPIGQALAGRNLYVLDRHLEPVPVGVQGELCIAGQLLARGYLNKPAQTAERFVANPFDDQGGRLYRTGDLVRWLDSGKLEYLGRVDDQVKVRGFRIEIGEVESQLQQLDGVREAVVITDETSSGPQLFAWAVLDTQAGEHTNGQSLRAMLAQNLPDYMVPSSICVVASIPLTPSGKLDRTALPKPTLDKEDYAAPINEAEQKLVVLWSDLLDIEGVGRHHNFFEVGGHSLLALQLHKCIEKQFNTTISLMDIFKYPTISKQAEYLSQVQTQQQPSMESQKQRAQKRRASVLSRRNKKHKVIS